MQHETVIVLDFGGQYNQLIARRVRENNVYCEIYSYKTDLSVIKAKNPKGIIFTGGPNSVYLEDSPTIDPEIFNWGVPVLGICYGSQLMMHLLGGHVCRAPEREYGKTEVFVDTNSKMFTDVQPSTICWMSHNDYIEQAAPGFKITAHTVNCPVAAAENAEKGLYAVQFHPEVLHTAEGKKMLRNFVYNVCGCTGDWKMDSFVENNVQALRERIGDGKVLCALSGGVDSSYITACLMPDETFSVGFASPDGTHKFDETTEAGELSDKLGIKNYREMLTKEQCLDAFADIQYHMDEPQSNLSSVPLWFLAEMARKDVTVVLSGEGADELFGGYAYYEDTVPVRKYKKMVPLPIRRALGNLALHMPYFKGHNFLVKGAEIPEKSFLGQALVWPEREVDGVLKPEYNTGDGAFELAAPIYARVKGQPELVKKQYLDMNMWLPGDILLKADKMCMAHSLELRVPFLDRKVMEFAEHIPDRYRINENGNKQVLRHAANKSLPDEWATRPKVGFPVPIVYWLREQKWYDYVKEYFTAPWASEFFDTDELMRLLDLHFAGKGDFQRKIYTPLVFLVWYKRFFIDEDQPAVQAA